MLREYLIHNTNEGKREGWYGKALINIGMRPGLPDYFYPVANKNFFGLWMEFKRIDQKYRKRNRLQDEWLVKLMKIGYYATYVYGCDEGIKIYTDYVNNRI